MDVEDVVIDVDNVVVDVDNVVANIGKNVDIAEVDSIDAVVSYPIGDVSEGGASSHVVPVVSDTIR